MAKWIGSNRGEFPLCRFITEFNHSLEHAFTAFGIGIAISGLRPARHSIALIEGGPGRNEVIPANSLPSTRARAFSDMSRKDLPRSLQYPPIIHHSRFNSSS